MLLTCTVPFLARIFIVCFFSRRFEAFIVTVFPAGTETFFAPILNIKPSFPETFTSVWNARVYPVVIRRTRIFGFFFAIFVLSVCFFDTSISYVLLYVCFCLSLSRTCLLLATSGSFPLSNTIKKAAMRIQPHKRILFWCFLFFWHFNWIPPYTFVTFVKPHVSCTFRCINSSFLFTYG